MSVLLMTFMELLLDLEQRCGLNSESALGAVTSSALTRATLARALSNAAKQCWEMPEGKNWVWPFTVLTKTVTPDPTTGKIALSDLDYGCWLSLWSADPRPASSAGRTANAYPISWNADSEGIWPAEVTATVFAFYIPRTPEYTSTAVVRATTYAVDAIVYDGVDNVAVDATKATGQCYRNLVSATGANLYDATKFQVQPVSKHFQSAMAGYAQAQYLRSTGNYDVAAAMDADAREDLERKFLGIYPNSSTGNVPPWVQRGAWR